MRHSAGWAVSAVLVVAATAANAQGPGGRNIRRRPMSTRLMSADRRRLQRPAITARRPLMVRRPRMRRRPDTGRRRCCRRRKSTPCCATTASRRSARRTSAVLTYVIAVIDRGGEDGRLVIDARNGRIIRFTPAFRWSNGYYGERSGYYGDRYAPPPPYGPPGVLPPMAPISGDARPTGLGAASGEPQRAAAATEAVLLAGRPPEVAPQKSAAVETKPAAPAPKPAAAPSADGSGRGVARRDARSGATVLAPEPKPAPAIAPTQPMPKVQGLE